MEEKRLQKRFVVEGMDIDGKIILTNEVNVLDISIDGMLVKADRRFDIGGQYWLRLRYGDNVLSLKGVVMWSVLSELRRTSADSRVPLYKAGIKFIDMARDKYDALIDFISSHETGPQ